MRPPKSSNCTTFDGNPSQPLITISKLKELFTSNEKSSLDEIKQKIQIVVDDPDSVFTDFINEVDHDYDTPEILNCTLFYTTACVCKFIKKRVKCTECLKAFLSESVVSKHHLSFTDEDLPNSFTKFLNNEKQLIHPKVVLYKILAEVENLFNQYRTYKNAFELIVSHFVERQNVIKFPCIQHVEDAKNIFINMVQYYLQIRIRQFIRDNNAEVKKDSILNRKRAKLCDN